ncbi:hypothetical protein G1C95_2344 [Bifidobacterium sp. DSM 109957]|uniref:Uncharacterized protein n=1 Tax=Bifidobacterium oedipodis TaxID=2675322 RepID=A0A7Y0ETN5_9BIFI|nr:hypothetical protein [Bifidobacterium sp. DSM 109957]
MNYFGRFEAKKVLIFLFGNNVSANMHICTQAYFLHIK